MGKKGKIIAIIIIAIMSIALIVMGVLLYLNNDKSNKRIASLEKDIENIKMEAQKEKSDLLKSMQEKNLADIEEAIKENEAKMTEEQKKANELKEAEAAKAKLAAEQEALKYKKLSDEEKERMANLPANIVYSYVRPFKTIYENAEAQKYTQYIVELYFDQVQNVDYIMVSPRNQNGANMQVYYDIGVDGYTNFMYGSVNPNDNSSIVTFMTIETENSYASGEFDVRIIYKDGREESKTIFGWRG